MTAPSFFQMGTHHCGCAESSHPTRLIAVTGGPGAGKTAILEIALRAFCSHVGVLPEAAGILFGGGFPRRDSEAAMKAIQKAIYHVQLEMEHVVLHDGYLGLALCDRGTIDGSAYWPGPLQEYWHAIGVTKEDAISRYSAVLHLRTPAIDQGYNHNNSLRTESADEASERDLRILEAWESHPNRLVVESKDDFVDKVTEALAFIRDQLAPCCRGRATS